MGGWVGPKSGLDSKEKRKILPVLGQPMFKTKLKYIVSADDQIPWLGAGVGIIMGVIIVAADHILTHKPTLVVSASKN
jgi:hypothetical protein